MAKKISKQEFLNEVEKRAYEIYTERLATGKHAGEMDDWLQAEWDVKQKYHIE